MREISINKPTFEEVSSKDRSFELMSSEFRQKYKAWKDREPKFEDLNYDQDIIDQDKAKVAAKESKFKYSETEIAALGETVIKQGLYEEAWVEAVVDVIPTNKFDDYFRGTDCVLRFESDSNDSLYLGVDVKTTADRGLVNDKIAEIEHFVSSGKLTNLKYFYDEDMDRKGPQRVPSIILIIDPRYAISMQDIMVKPYQKRNEKEAQKTELVKNLLSLEILCQCMEIDLRLEERQEVQPRYLEIQKTYQEIIESIIQNTDIVYTINYLLALIKIVREESSRYEDLLQVFEKYLQTLIDYQQKREVNYVLE